MKRLLLVVALMSLVSSEALATPFLVCMKRYPLRGGGSCLACEIVDLQGMTTRTDDDACGGLQNRRFYREEDAIRFVNRHCDCR
jgi:hypothetical protein